MYDIIYILLKNNLEFKSTGIFKKVKRREITSIMK